jgi:hypothetical protein
LAGDPNDAAKLQNVAGVKEGLLDPEEAIAACEVAASEHPETGRLHYQLGRAYAKAKRPEMARQALLQAASLGHAQAMFWLALSFFDSTGPSSNSLLAVQWLQAGAAGGSQAAMFRLAEIHEGSYTAPDPPFVRDPIIAKYWYEKLVERGDAEAALKLALMYDGGGLGRDTEKALGLIVQHLRMGGDLTFVPPFLFPGVTDPNNFLSAPLRIAMQKRLSKEGLLKTAADGVFGPSTNAAITRWRQELSANREKITDLVDGLPAPSTEEISIARKIAGCVSSGAQTIKELQECSGFWVTPRALALCAMGTTCPALPDTEVGWETFKSTIDAAELDIQAKLELDPKSLPLPEAAIIADCAGRVETSFIDCSLTQIAAKKYPQVDCLFQQDSAAAFAKCVADKSGDLEIARYISCLGSVEPSIDQLTKCGVIPNAQQAEIARIAACEKANETDRAGLALCALDRKGEVAKAYKCISDSKELVDALANCNDSIGDEKTRRAVACMAKASSNAQMASCAAASVLPKEAARIASCAATSQGYASFGLCAVGPKMNEEWRIAAGCALESSGNPYYFAGCTATRLTIRELAKCINGKIGKDCFGKNNTFVEVLRLQYGDTLLGPGKDNDLVQAISAVGIDAQTISDVMRPPAREAVDCVREFTKEACGKALAPILKVPLPKL